jgi:hypothetical protein
MSTVDLPHKWQWKWQVMLQEMYEADNLRIVRWQPVLDVAEEEGHYALYTPDERFSNKPNANVLKAFKTMMSDFYTRKICLKLRQPHCGNPLPIGSCTKSRRHSIVSNAAAKAAGRRAITNAISNADRKADGRQALSSAISNLVYNAKTKADGRRAIWNSISSLETKRKRVAVAAAELQPYRSEHAGDGGVFVPIDTIQEVLTTRHRFDSSAYGSRPLIKKLTIKQAFDSKEFAIYFGITKQRLGSMDDFLRLNNKGLHDEPFR